MRFEVKSKWIKKIIFFSFIAIVILGCYILNYIPHLKFNSEHFKIEVLKSSKDYDNDGIDDYTDILEGAKIAEQKNAKYLDKYYDGGYPPEEFGVCTDVVWRSLANAGYDLKKLMDEDIKNNVSAYPWVNGTPDPNIDFRRVPNQKMFFERNAQSLTTDLKQTDQWMPGDIVVFSNNHIGIISDKRNYKGIPFIIHSGSNLQIHFEEDKLELLELIKGITGHYRLKE